MDRTSRLEQQGPLSCAVAGIYAGRIKDLQGSAKLSVLGGLMHCSPSFLGEIEREVGVEIGRVNQDEIIREPYDIPAITSDAVTILQQRFKPEIETLRAQLLAHKKT